MTRIGWRLTLGAALTLIVAGAAAVAILALRDSPGASSSTRTRAQREADRLIAAVRLPGAVTSAPSGGSPQSALARLDRPPAPDTAERSADWSVPEPAARVRAFLVTHPPQGTRPSRTGRLTFIPIVRREGLVTERLALTVLPLGRGASAVRAEAYAGWRVRRSPSERLPAGVGGLEITRGPLGQPPSLVIRVHSAQLIRRIGVLLDGLAPVQPSRVYHCAVPAPEIPVVSFIFRAGARHARVLAVATEQADVRSPTTACDAVHLAIGGRVREPLLGGYRLLRQVSALLGRRLWTPPYAA